MSYFKLKLDGAMLVHVYRNGCISKFLYNEMIVYRNTCRSNYCISKCLNIKLLYIKVFAYRNDLDLKVLLTI